MLETCLNVVTFPGTPCWMQHVGYWFNQHQTLLTGVLAVAVGVITLRALNRQIQASESAHFELIKRKNRAAKASLPSALSEIQQYVEDCVDQIRSLQQTPVNQTPAPSMPTYPANAMATVALVIESAEADDAKKLAGLLADSQVQHARLSKQLADARANRRPNAMGTRTSYFDALALAKHADRAYDYGRGDSTNIGEMENADEAIKTLRVRFRVTDDALEQHIKNVWPPTHTNYAQDLKDW